MVARELLDPDSSLWHWLASDLHFYRSKHKMTCAQVGSEIGLTKGAVSNLEAARPGFRLQDKQAEKLDQLWELNGHFTRMLKYARRGHDPNWFESYAKTERTADTIKTFELALVPGLLQTEGYARALLSAGRVVEDVDAKIASRMKRQEILQRPNPPELWVLINQGVLDQPVGGSEVMRGQLDALLSASERPNVILRVVPRSVGAHVGLEGGFIIMYSRGHQAAYMEAVGGGRLSDDRAEVERYAVRFDRIGADALNREASRKMIIQAMEAMS